MANKNPVTDNFGTHGGYKKTLQDNRVAIFKSYYIDPKSESFMNVMRSALRAGYSDTYARNITVQKPSWWVELMEDSDVRRARMLAKAEDALEEAIDFDSSDKDYAKLRLQASTFVSERLGKDHYSARQELTARDGRALIPSESRASQKVPLTSLFKGVQDHAKEESQ